MSNIFPLESGVHEFSFFTEATFGYEPPLYAYYVWQVGETLLELVVDENHSKTTHLEGVQVVSTDVESGEPVLTSSGSPKTRESRQNVLSTPAVRHIAKEYGVNVEDIPGTGKDGRVLKEDVLKYVNDKESMWDEISPIAEASRPLEAEFMNSRSEADLTHLKSRRKQILEDKIIPLRYGKSMSFFYGLCDSCSWAQRLHYHEITGLSLVLERNVKSKVCPGKQSHVSIFNSIGVHNWTFASLFH
jgi:hypothetical protein